MTLMRRRARAMSACCVRFSFSAFAIVERSGGRTVLQAGQGSQVAGSQQSAVEAPRPVQVAADARGVAWDRGQTGDAGQPIDRVEAIEAAADLCEERGGQHGPETGHADEDFGAPMVFEAAGDVGVDLFEFLVDRGDLGGEPSHQLRSDRLGGQCAPLSLGGIDGHLGDCGAVTGAACFEPCRQSGGTDPAQRLRGLIPR